MGNIGLYCNRCANLERREEPAVVCYRGAGGTATIIDIQHSIFISQYILANHVVRDRQPNSPSCLKEKLKVSKHLLLSIPHTGGNMSVGTKLSGSDGQTHTISPYFCRRYKIFLRRPRANGRCLECALVRDFRHWQL